MIEHDVNVDGTYCQLTFSFDNITNYRAAAVGFQSEESFSERRAQRRFFLFVCFLKFRGQWSRLDLLDTITVSI